LSTIPDNFGEFPAADRKKVSKAGFAPDRDLPPELKVALGQKLTVGAIEVEPVKVEARPLLVNLVSDRGIAETARPTASPAVVLTLRIRNTSNDLSLYPMDPAFNRKFQRDRPQPWTGVVVGSQKFWGGAFDWPFRTGLRRQYDTAQEADATPLKPMETREYVVFTDTVSAVVKTIREARDPMLWRVQVRRGMVDYLGKEVPVSAIIGVEFRASDVKNPE